jgi:hypothetical protein
MNTTCLACWKRPFIRESIPSSSIMHEILEMESVSARHSVRDRVWEKGKENANV